jgi:2-haloacid dehalogenase
VTTPRACLFDVYGTLLDVHSAVARAGARLGAIAPSFSALWRSKQLEYSWVRSLMGSYRDFWQLTGDALDYALRVHGLSDSELRSELLAAYRQLSAFPEVPAVLAGLRARQVRVVAFSNGPPAMLEESLAGGGLSALVDGCVSVHELGIYKPSPAVYRHALAQLDLTVGEVAFFSSNRWDVAGAAACGWRVYWVNRARLPDEYGPQAGVQEIETMANLPSLLV